MSWRNLLASIFGDFCGGSNCPGVTPTIPAKKADAREFQDCYCARISLCWAPRSRMIDLGQSCTLFCQYIELILQLRDLNRIR
jgi:hypothetical protein